MENWKPFPGFEGQYEISDQGRVKSLPRFERGKRKRFRDERILALYLRSRYWAVGLKDAAGKMQRFNIHRVVALAFLGESPEGCPNVDHINGNPLDNRVENLRYASVALNTRNSDFTRSKHGFRGVFAVPNSKRNPWMARIVRGGKQVYIGAFPTAEAAGAAYAEYVSANGLRDAE